MPAVELESASPAPAPAAAPARRRSRGPGNSSRAARATETVMKGANTIAVKGTPIDYEKKPEKMTCGVRKCKFADAGRNADDKLLRGWIDVDEFYGGGPAPPVTGANAKVFVGNDPAKNGAEALGAVAR